MLKFFGKKSSQAVDNNENLKQVVFKIEGMHCVSCSLNIDGTLEDLPGVVRAETSYAQSETRVTYDEGKISVAQLSKAVSDTGYSVVQRAYGE